MSIMGFSDRLWAYVLAVLPNHYTTRYGNIYSTEDSCFKDIFLFRKDDYQTEERTIMSSQCVFSVKEMQSSLKFKMCVCKFCKFLNIRFKLEPTNVQNIVLSDSSYLHLSNDAPHDIFQNE